MSCDTLKKKKKDFQLPPRKESDHSFAIQHIYGALTMC